MCTVEQCISCQHDEDGNEIEGPGGTLVDGREFTDVCCGVINRLIETGKLIR